jgi:hypothetical protein
MAGSRFRGTNRQSVPRAPSFATSGLTVDVGGFLNGNGRLVGESMNSSMRSPLRIEEDNRVDRLVNKVDYGKRPMAKAAMGAAIKHAIGDQPLKEFGDKGLVSNVCSGEKVPDYLARIYQDAGARRRFALALLEDDPGVEIETVIKIRGAA